MSTAVSQPHVNAAKARKAAQRTFIRHTAAVIEAQIEGKAPPAKRRRFFISREPLIFVDEPQPTPQAEPRISTLSLLMLAAAVLIAIGAAVKGGFFAWRPGDQAVSTIDYRFAPHLQPLKEPVK